jgi:Fic family protein
MSKTNGHSKKNGKKNGATKRQGPYDFNVFVKNWTKAANVAEVVAMTGLSKNTVSAMSTKLRKAGVKLKIMPRRTARVIDAAALNAIVKDATR